MANSEKSRMHLIGQPNGPKPGRPKGTRNKITVQDIEAEIRKIALFDPIGIFRQVGKGEAAAFRVRDVTRMPPEVRACIAKMKIRLEKSHEKDADGNYKTEEILEITFWDKTKALEMCAKHFGWVTTKPNTLVGRELRELLEEGRRRVAALRAQAIDVAPSASALLARSASAIDVTPARLMSDEVNRHQSADHDSGLFHVPIVENTGVAVSTPQETLPERHQHATDTPPEPDPATDDDADFTI